MALERGTFLDTSVLLGGLIELEPPADAAQAIWGAVASGEVPAAKSAWHCCLEFYSVATRLPGEFRLTPADALRLAEEEILKRLDVHDLHAPSRVTLLRNAAADELAGGRIYDAHIAEVARTAGASVVVTENRRHFTQLLRYGVRVLTAAEFAAEAGLG